MVGDELVEGQQTAVGVDDQAEAFVRAGLRSVVGTDAGGEPALVDAAAAVAERVVVVGVQADPLAGGAEGARPKRGCRSAGRGSG